MNTTFRHHAYKVEIKPTPAQINIIERTIVVCRYVYNLFIATNRYNYSQSNNNYMNGYDFSKWLNHESEQLIPISYRYGKYRLKQ